jgi:hypothetical protein
MKPGHATWITYCVVCSAACTNNGSGRPKKFCSPKHKATYKKTYSKNAYIPKGRFRRDWNEKWVRECKMARGNCLDCGFVQDERTSAAFQWDHRDPMIKLFEMSNIPARTMKYQIIEEMAKCDVVCANCHALRPTSSLGKPKHMQNRKHRQLDLGGFFAA